MPIRVVVAEDHALLRESLRLLLDVEEGIEVVAEVDGLESRPSVPYTDALSS